jgi:hypothetical protein
LLLADRTRLHRLVTRVVAGTAAVACLFGGAAYADTTGIDVSRWQHGATLNWQKVRADGVTFAFIKATEAANYTNDHFAADWAGTRRAGIYRGAYHLVPGLRDAVAHDHLQGGLQGWRGIRPLGVQPHHGAGALRLAVWLTARAACAPSPSAGSGWCPRRSG